jgi:hypothetical protein
VYRIVTVLHQEIPILNCMGKGLSNHKQPDSLGFLNELPFQPLFSGYPPKYNLAEDTMAQSQQRLLYEMVDFS